MKPITLPPNVLPHFYKGGSRLARLRGFVPQTEFGPEDWLAATVHRAGEPDLGPSRLADGTLFADVVAADPAGWLGSADGGPMGPADTGILVKLLDADQRLPVHVHPGRGFAGTHLHSCYGKTEAWYVLAAEGETPCVWVGFAEEVDPIDLVRATEEQDSEWLLSRMNRIDVTPGDGILVPAGTAHAIGAGVFVVEVQEPTDLSILLEWSITTSGREDSHLDLGFDVAFTAVSHEKVDAATLATLVLRGDPARTADLPLRLLPETADPFFTMALLAPQDRALTVAAGYSVVVVVDGEGVLHGADSEQTLRRGEVLAVPAGAGDWTLSGHVQLVQCRPGPPPVADPAADVGLVGARDGGAA